MLSKDELKSALHEWSKQREVFHNSNAEFFSKIESYSDILAEFLLQKTCGSFLSGFGLYEGKRNFDAFISTFEDAAHRLFYQGKIVPAENLLNHIYELKYEDLLHDRSFKYVKRVNFEIASICNLKCKYCTFASGKRKKFIDINLFEIILQSIADNHPRLQTLALYMSGESLLHPGFIKLLNTINKIKQNSFDFNPEIYLHTNGTLWTPAMNDKIMTADVLNRIVWSIDGVDRQSFEEMRGSSNTYDNVLSNFEYFLSNRPATVSACVNNLREPHLLEEKLDPQLDKLFRRADNTSISPPRDLNKHGLSQSRFIGKAKKFCEYIFHTVVITTDGKMSLCCADYNSENAFGDLSADSFFDVYYGAERLRNLNNMATGNRDKNRGCSNCKLLHVNWFEGYEFSRILTDEVMFQKKKMIIKKWNILLSKYAKREVAIYGAGKHTHMLNQIVMMLDHTIIGHIVDDFPSAYPCLFGKKIVHPKNIEGKPVKAVILSTDCAQKKIAARCREIFGKNVNLIDLYDNNC